MISSLIYIYSPPFSPQLCGVWPLDLYLSRLSWCFLIKISLQYLILFDWFLHENTPTKWKQGTFFVVFHDSVYIYRYTFSIFQYTFIGWVWGGPAAHLHQVHVRDTPPGHRNDTNRWTTGGYDIFITCPAKSMHREPEVHAFCGTGDENIMPTCREAGN